MKLFNSIFGHADETRGRYPEWLIESAIDRAVEGTDPRIKFVSGYRKRLRPAVIRSMDHVVALVDAFPEAVPIGRAEYSEDPRLGALFASADSMLDTLGRDKALRDYLGGPGVGSPCVTTLIMVDRVDRRGLGSELVDDRLQREVAQIRVSFSAHRLLDPTDSEQETRRHLKRRAFDHLLSLALRHISESQVERADLVRQRDLLYRKLSALEEGGWSFEPVGDHALDPSALQVELDGITQQLDALGPDTGLLATHLDLVTEVLDNPQKHLWTDGVELYLDAMNLLRHPQDPSARHIQLQEIQNERGRKAIILLVSLRPRDLPPREDLISAAERYLY
ncbi:hypothetical protein ThidrDRAFT_0034 [Thiorhodococcus drewsii AZ1]|uniref:Uncharacterized protein n=1 Tax=Thiorhodococcus drewsii AZ1 TaxID=765913 RepID=G2DVX3_9GAMM|nr:hypothetical protein [Thiorhodococcus drewsii]EGV33879.1 hypothetical protein ThidrDRAFT_0034 [Thiorhodococcus drewsii AZ1]